MAILSAAGLEAAQQTAATAQASTGFVDVDGGKLYYEESNHGGQTVVLVHDGAVDSAVWNDVWPEFCQHFHAVRYDRRGFGKSPAILSARFVMSFPIVKGTASTPSGERFSRISAYAVENHNQEGAPSQARE